MAKGQHTLNYQAVKAMLSRTRQNAGFTQRELAKRLRRTQPWVHKSEVGERRVDISEFLDWCLACGVNPEEAFRQLVKMRK